MKKARTPPKARVPIAAPPEPERKTELIAVKVTPGFLKRLADWCNRQKTWTSRGSAIRILVERSLDAEEGQTDYDTHKD